MNEVVWRAQPRSVRLCYTPFCIQEDMAKMANIETVGIAGAGTMGSGIAHVFARSGMRVILCDVEQNLLDRALSQIRTNLGQGSVEGQDCRSGSGSCGGADCADHRSRCACGRRLRH